MLTVDNGMVLTFPPSRICTLYSIRPTIVGYEWPRRKKLRRVVLDAPVYDITFSASCEQAVLVETPDVLVIAVRSKWPVGDLSKLRAPELAGEQP